MKKNKKMRTWRPIIIISTVIIALIAFVIFYFKNLSDKVNGCENLRLSDWLTASCTILSLIGTVLLSCVSIYQSGNANDINERLFAQNNELQKITDYQAKLSNQENYPFLCADEVKFSLDDVEDEMAVDSSWFKKGEDNYSFLEYYHKLLYKVNCKTNEKEIGKHFILTFSLYNNSNAKISRLKIKEYSFKNPLILQKNVSIECKNILQKGDKINYEFNFYVDDAFQEDKVKLLNVKMAIEITLVTGIVFIEEIRLTNCNFAEPGYIIETIVPL